MLHPTDDLRIDKIRPLVPPAILMENLPITERASATVALGRQAITRALRGEDDRLVVIVGPCSIHDVGWKGLINDPHLDGSFAINQGLHVARSLLLDLAESELPTGCEFLDTITPQYLADLVSWGAIGARTTESQVHRELASGLSVPVGFKNGTDGNVQIAIDAVQAASHPHHFLSVTKQGVSAIVSTRGNGDGHIILRGAAAGPNFGADAVATAVAALKKAGLHPRVMIDCSHGNSRKDPGRQPSVAEDIAAQIASGSNAISGVMIESHLVGGRQDPAVGLELAYGQSITDACLGWDETIPVFERLAAAVRSRRRARV